MAWFVYPPTERINFFTKTLVGGLVRPSTRGKEDLKNFFTKAFVSDLVHPSSRR